MRRRSRSQVVRILICDDSRTFAVGLKRFLEYDDDLRVAAITSSAEQALEQVVRVQPDLVTMDIELPGIDGIEGTKRLLERHPVPIVVLSAHTPRGSERAAEALAAGAVDVLAKSGVRLDEIASAASDSLRKRIKSLAAARATQIPAADRVAVDMPPAATREGNSAALREPRTVIAIGASTGGPQALLQILSALPAGFDVPVLVVQHMASGFTAGLTRWLDQQVALPVRLAEHGIPVAGGVWFAPEDVHLALAPSMHLALDATTDAGVHRPAADVLLKSAADAAGAGAVAVVLTGMGRDGAEGLAAVRAAGGLTIAQDERSSVVWGMPRVALERGAEFALDPAQIGAVLRALPRTKASR